MLVCKNHRRLKYTTAENPFCNFTPCSSLFRSSTRHPIILDKVKTAITLCTRSSRERQHLGSIVLHTVEAKDSLTSYINGLQCKSFFLIWDKSCLVSHSWHGFNRIHRIRAIRSTHCKSNTVITDLGVTRITYKWKKKSCSGSDIKHHGV